MESQDQQLAAAWRSAAREPAVVAQLERLFGEVAGEVAARGPACWASGRCCQFEQFGHRLYVTGLEAAYAVTHLPTADVPAPKGTLPILASAPPPPTLTAASLADARARGGCPFQRANLCGVHEIKPLACRVYFCDRSAQDWQQDLMERLMTQLRALHDREGIPYRYLEWRSALEMLVI